MNGPSAGDALSNVDEIKRAVPELYDNILHYTAKRFPQYAAWSRRLVTHPGNYPTFRRFADVVGLGLGAFETISTLARPDQRAKMLRSAWPDIMMHSIGSIHEWQSWLVSKNLFKAMALTDAPETWDLYKSSRLPFDAVYFILDRDSFVIGGDPVQIIGAAHVKKDQHQKVLPIRWDEDVDTNESLLTVAYTMAGRIFFNRQVVVDGKVTCNLDNSLMSLYDRDSPWVPDEEEAARSIMPLALQFITVMQCAEQLVEKQRRLGFVGKESKGTRKEKVEPGWLGRHFVIPDHEPHKATHRTLRPGEEYDEEREHRTLRPHFRRGHWRGVRHGEGRKLVRHDWFPPCFVNAQQFSP